jgi:hypothetical protein
MYSLVRLRDVVKGLLLHMAGGWKEDLQGGGSREARADSDTDGKDGALLPLRPVHSLLKIVAYSIHRHAERGCGCTKEWRCKE